MKYLIILAALAIPATPQNTTYGTAKWNRADTVTDQLKDSEIADIMPLALTYQIHYTAMRVAEVAYETSGGTRERKRPLQERFDAAKKLADDAMGKIVSKVDAACTARKMKECVLEVPASEPKEAKLRGVR